jgi:fluoride exporter
VVFVMLPLVGAGFGAVFRYMLGGWINHKMGPEIPWGRLP